jgi:multiple sugar transport system ATP-binding protein
MTVRQNLAFSLMLAKKDKATVEAKVARAAEILALSALMDRYPRQLSGGQRQRVAMGRAIVRDPQVFLFDEPLSNLDAKLRVAMRGEIKELHQRLKTTSIYVTHDQIEAMTMATRIAIINAGVIQQFDTPDAVYDRPANLFVAGFIGAPAMNLFPATVSLSDGKPSAALRGADARIDLSSYAFVTAPRDGDSIMVGLRPEHFLAPDEATGDAAAVFRLPVQYTEKTGADATGYFKTEQGLLAVSTSPDRIGEWRQGEVTTLGFPHGKLHAFDAATGQRL